MAGRRQLMPIMAALKREKPIWSPILLAWLQEQYDWPGLAYIGRITATRKDKGAGTVQTRPRYYLLSRIMTTQEFLDTVRSH